MDIVACVVLSKIIIGKIAYVRDVERVKKKICLLGDPAVGKTSLIRRFVVDKYDDKYISTLGTKVSKKDISIAKPRKVNLTMVIWDLAGQKEFSQVHAAAFKNAAGALVVGDITRKETVDNLENWISKLFNVQSHIPIILLMNKYDLKDQAQIDEGYMEPLASGLKAKHFFTSAKTGENVEIAFQTLGRMMLGMMKAPTVTVDEKAVEKKREKLDKKPILELEDKLITHFCKILGDTEIGMSIVRKQFNDAGIDFNNPTYDDMVKIADRLVESIRVFKGDKKAKQVRIDFNRLLGQALE